MKIAVFGGAGFIGSAIVDQLLSEGHEINVFEKPSVLPFRKFSPNENVTWLNGDFTNVEDISKAMEKCEAVIHLISTTLPKSSNENMVYDVESNVIGTLRLLAEMKKAAIKKIIFISSGGTVYGEPEFLPISEEHPTNPLTSYGITKLAIEKYLLLFKKFYGFKTIILRVANPYGERQSLVNMQGAMGIFLKKAIAQEAVEIWGDGNISRDYIYISDIAQAFSKALKYEGEHSIFNIGSGTGINLNELIEAINNVTNLDLKATYTENRIFDVQKNVLDISLANKELKWLPQVQLEEGISKTYQWIKSQSNF